MKHGSLLAICWVGLLVGATPALAADIVLTQEGYGNGRIDGVAFPLSHFVMTAYANTAERRTEGFGYWLPHSAASIDIDGLGTFHFLIATRTFVNSSHASVGFGRYGLFEGDLFDGPTNAQFAAWDMLSPVGPVSGGGVLLQWDPDHGDVLTTGGILEFDFRLNVPVTFSATVPASASVGPFAATVLVVQRRRRLS